MTHAELDAQIGQLEAQYRGTPETERSKMRPQIQQITCTVQCSVMPVPPVPIGS